jgi:hypothetical protein
MAIPRDDAGTFFCADMSTEADSLRAKLQDFKAFFYQKII